MEIRVPKLALYLLSTEGCHLCENAKQILDNMQQQYQYVDIMEEERLVQTYGEHIPVIIAESAEQALFWPFNEQQIEQYKEHYGIS